MGDHNETNPMSVAKTTLELVACDSGRKGVAVPMEVVNMLVMLTPVVLEGELQGIAIAIKLQAPKKLRPTPHKVIA